MIMKMCDRCHKRLAVIFITHKTGNEVKNEGLCLRCAKEAGLQPNADMLKNLGINLTCEPKYQTKKLFHAN